MRRPFALALGVVGLTVPLTWLWVNGAQDAYVAFFAAVAQPVLEPLGVSEVVVSPARKRFISYVPFLVLVVVTPGLTLRRRLLGLLVGFPLIFACHVGLVVVEAFALTGARPTDDAFSTLFPAAMFADAFPFALWALIAHPQLRTLLTRSPEGRS